MWTLAHRRCKPLFGLSVAFSRESKFPSRLTHTAQEMEVSRRCVRLESTWIRSRKKMFSTCTCPHAPCARYEHKLGVSRVKSCKMPHTCWHVSPCLRPNYARPNFPATTRKYHSLLQAVEGLLRHFTHRFLSFNSIVLAGSAWLVTFPEGRDHELFEVSTDNMGGTSPFALVEEVGARASKDYTGNRSDQYPQCALRRTDGRRYNCLLWT